MSGIGVNLRVTGHCSQGSRKYMEDMFSVAYQQTEDLKELEYAYFGIFDGHGGPEAAVYAKNHLIDSIVSQNNFWSNNDEDVLRAIHDGYVNTHYAMYKQHESWPKTASGLPSTSGTTATIAFIRKSKLYIGHVGDSRIVLGYKDNDELCWKARLLTKDHKPECHVEINRIRECGGKVVSRSGVPRVVWNRPRLGHKGPVRRSTPIDEIPFLAVARALGDFWSYNSALDKFIVSPEPDVQVFHINVETDRCLILGTDGLWNMLSPGMAVNLVQNTESHNERQVLNTPGNLHMQYDKNWINPSKCLVDKAIARWSFYKQRADNTSVVTLLLDRPGPPKTPVTPVPRLPINGYSNENTISPCNSDDNDKINKLHRISMFTQHKQSGGTGVFKKYPLKSVQPSSATAALMNKSVDISENMSYQLSSNYAVSKYGKIDCLEDSNTTFERDQLNYSITSDLDCNINISDTENDIQIDKVSSSGLDIDGNNELLHDSSISSPVKRKLSSCSSMNSSNSNKNRSKSVTKRCSDSDDGNSDIENKLHCSYGWNKEAVSSNLSKDTIIASNHKRKKFSFEKRLTFDEDCSCAKTASFPCCDKSRANKTKLLVDTPTRILRSDTIAATPVRTLRSRNINLALTTPSSKIAESKSVRSVSKTNDVTNTLKRSNSNTTVVTLSTPQSTQSATNKLLRHNRAATMAFSCPSKRLTTRFTSPTNQLSATTRTASRKPVK